MEITKKFAEKVLDLVDEGLCNGTGKGKPGQMCVNAAIAYAMGENPMIYQPSCVSHDLIAASVTLNDQPWRTKKERAAGMRRLAIAQLGTRGDGHSYARFVMDRVVMDALIKRAEEMKIQLPTDVRIYYKPSSFIASFCKGHNGEFLKLWADTMADELVRLKSPGSKFLCLLEEPKKEEAP